MTAVVVIIPVRDLAAHAELAVASLRAQLGEDDRICVVDDASREPIGPFGDLRIEVVRLDEPHGPYRARNFAAERRTEPLLLFVDARCRAYDGLLEQHRATLSQPGIALSCTNVETIRSNSAASRIAAARDPFHLRNYVGVSGRLDYFPTANLGVRRAAFEAVGGFLATRSGADADLCWRIQESGAGRMLATDRTLMGWVPRESMRGLFEQFYRYGRSSVLLDGAPGGHEQRTERPLRKAVTTLAWWYRANGRSFRTALLAASVQVPFLAGRWAGRRSIPTRLAESRP